MKVIDALRIEGTPNFGVLCYGIFSTSNLDSAFHAFLSAEVSPTSKIHKLIAEQSQNGAILNEIVVAAEVDVPVVISEAINRMFDVGPCLFVVCMYDGAFGGYDDLFSSVLANQTYAFCFAKGEQIVNLDADILSSKEWETIIALCRKRTAR